MKLGRNIWFAVALLILIGSFFMPNAVAGVTDARRIDNLIVINAQSITYEAAPELSIHERLEIAANPNTEMLTLKTGQMMSVEFARDKALREIARFFRGDMFDFIYEKCIVEEGIALFIIDTTDPSISLIVWKFILSDSVGNEVTVTIDDDTGIILNLLYKKGNRSSNVAVTADTGKSGSLDDTLNAAALRLSEMMAMYYSMQIILGDYEFSPGGNFAYYRADITGIVSVIPMYGVVRANGFSMNERAD